MSDVEVSAASDGEVEGAGEAAAVDAGPQPDVTDPAKLIRLGTMLQTVLAELQGSETDPGGVARLAQIHRETVEELRGS